MIERVLTVCTGNICRSPLAAVQLYENIPRLTVASAGIGALVGRPADPHALTVAVDAGLNLDEHRARQLSEELVSQSDLILVMEKGQAAWIDRQFPHARGRVFLLGHWDREMEVPDPYGRSLESFRTVHTQIRTFCNSWMRRLEQK